MSHMETWKVEINTQPVDVNEVKSFYNKLGFDLPEFKESYEFSEWHDWECDLYRKYTYLFFNGNYYKVNCEDLGEDWSRVKIEGQEGKLSYMLNFYNGGTCLIEQLVSILEELPTVSKGE